MNGKAQEVTTVEEHENIRPLEQHVGTILQIVVVALLGWAGIALVTLQSAVAVLRVEVQTMQTTLQKGTSDPYNGTDASRDFNVIRHEMSFLEKRIGECEEKLSKGRL